MEWTNEDKEYLQSFRTSIEDDNIKLKEEIKQVLLNNKYICHVLNDTELEEADAEISDYFGHSILPYFLIPEVQHNVKNYICFETDSLEMDRYNPTVKNQQIIFYVLCEQKGNIDEETSLPRHDLLAALLIHEFNYYPFKGGKAQLVSDKPGVTDNNYATRTLTFEFKTDANIIKSVDGKNQIINKVFNK